MLSSSSLPAFLLLPGSSFAEEKESATRDALFQELCLVIVMLSFCKSVSCFSGVGAAVAPGDQSFFRDQMRCDPGMGRGPRRPRWCLLLRLCCTWPGLLLSWRLSSVWGEDLQGKLAFLLLSLSWGLSQKTAELFLSSASLFHLMRCLWWGSGLYSVPKRRSRRGRSKPPFFCRPRQEKLIQNWLHCSFVWVCFFAGRGGC